MKLNILKKTQTYHILLWVLFFAAGSQVVLSFTDTTISPPTAAGQSVPSIKYPVMSATTTATQTKSGGLTIHNGNFEVKGLTTLSGPVTIVAGSPGIGKVLVSDGDGNGRWASLVVNDAVVNACRRQTESTNGSQRVSMSTRTYKNAAGQHVWDLQRGGTGKPWYNGTSRKFPANGTHLIGREACVYYYYQVQSGGSEAYRYCDGVDVRVSAKNESWGDCTGQAYGLNGTYAKDKNDCGGNGAASAVCREVNFNYVYKTAADCTNGSGTVGMGHYTGTAAAAVTDTTVSSSPIIPCNMKFYPKWECPADNATYRFSKEPNLSTGKCTRTKISNNQTAEVNAVKPGAIKQCNVAGGWTPFRVTGRCIGGTVTN